MEGEWSDGQPIYRQLRDRAVALILEGVLGEGDALPSVRSVAAEFRVNPLTVLKAYQQLVDEGLLESRRGLGMFVLPGAREQLMRAERRPRQALRASTGRIRGQGVPGMRRRRCSTPRASTSRTSRSPSSRT